MQLKSNQAGFTLFELLAALTLSSMLVVALLGVVGGLAKNENVLKQHEPTPAWHLRLASRLEKDLQAADHLKIRPNGFQLQGLLARDRQSGKRLWQEAVISYEIRKTSLGIVLERTEKNLGLGKELRRELLAIPVKKMLLMPFNREQVSLDQTTEFISMLESGPPPESIRLRIELAGEPSFDQIILSE